MVKKGVFCEFMKMYGIDRDEGDGFIEKKTEKFDFFC